MPSFSSPILTDPVFDTVFGFPSKHGGGGEEEENWISEALLMIELL